MRIHLAGVFVDDQQKALRFYTETLGFQLKHNIPLGEYAWITVVSAEDPEGTEFLLEPDAHPAVRPFLTRWWRTVSPAPPSRSTTCKPNTSVSRQKVCDSYSRQQTSGRSSPRYSTIPAAT